MVPGRTLFILLCFVAVSRPVPAQPRPPALHDVLQRAGAYVVAFQHQLAAEGVFRVNAEVWAIEYEEKDRPTFIRTTARKSLPSKGRFWIEPDTGRVLMSELILKDRDVNAIIDVSYQSEPLLGFLVPIEMRERYEGRFDKSHIEGVATYGRFRQFQVNTTETFQIKR